MYNSNIFDKIQLMEWENKDDIDKTWTNCKLFFKERYKTKKCFGSTQQTGFESAANLNEVHKEEMKIMESNHNSEHINAFQETSQSMVDMCAALAVAKAEQGDQIAKLTTKIDLLTKLVENFCLRNQHQQQRRRLKSIWIETNATNVTKRGCVGRMRRMRKIGPVMGSR